MTDPRQGVAAPSGQKRRNLVAWFSTTAVVLVVVGTLFATVSFRKTADEYRRVENLLLSLEQHAHELNSLEWQAIAERALDPAIAVKVQRTRAELDGILADLASRVKSVQLAINRFAALYPDCAAPSIRPPSL